MKHFSDLGLSEPILRAVTEEGYSTPTPIQAQVIPAMIAGEDILGTAQTGTGKTAAFVLPTLHRIASLGSRPKPKTCRALIVAPTRELAAQIGLSAKTYAKHGHQSVAVVVGGVKPGPQARTLARGVDILVATPGRLLDHMGAGVVSLSETRTVILDEADHMMDMGFIPDIRKIMKALPKDRQTALLSATMPKQIRRLAKDFLTDPVEVAVAPESKPIERIDQKVIFVERARKRKVLIDILNDTLFERAIIFTRTKRGADSVTARLEKAKFDVVSIHGNKSQGQRRRALKAFKDYDVNVMVATDIAARGIDVDGISHVFNFDLPEVPESYVHRIGRTARAGKSGHAISLVSEDQRNLLKAIEKLTGEQIPKENMTTSGDASDRQEDISQPSRPPQRNKPKQRRRPKGPNTQHDSKKPRPKSDKPKSNKPKSEGGNKPRRSKPKSEQASSKPNRPKQKWAKPRDRTGGKPGGQNRGRSSGRNRKSGGKPSGNRSG